MIKQSTKATGQSQPSTGRVSGFLASGQAAHSKKAALLSAAPQTNTTKISPNTTSQLSVMQIALIVSALIHLIILSIHFEPELRKFRDQLPVLEVMLVNTKTKAQPKNADVFAQANLDRGGNTNEERMMKSALPSTQQPKLNNVISATLQNKSAPQTPQDDHAPNAEEKEQKRLAALEKQAQELMIQLKSAAKVKAKSEVDETNTSAENKKVAMDEVNQALLEMNRLEALIAKQQEEYQKRPKRKFIGARATEYRYAMYVDAWRQKIEKIGNKNYPAAAKKLKLYGQLQMTVSIKKDGSIENIELNRSSGHKVLDEAARHIVELGAPYAKFSEDIRKDTDILSITRTWTFTREASLSTQQ